MVTVLEGIIITTFEAISMKIFFETFLGKSEYAKEWVKKALVVFLVIGLLMVAFVDSDVVLVKPIIAIAIISLIMWLYYRERIIQIVIIASIFDGILYAVDYLTILMIKYLFQDEFKEIWNNKTKAVFIALASKTIVFMIVVIISKRWNRDDSLNLITDAEWVRFIYFPTLTIVAITILLAERNKMSNTLLIIGFGLVIMDMVVFYMIRDVVSRERNIQTMLISEERTKNQLKLYENMEETIRENKKNFHDFKNQIMCISELISSGNIDEALKYSEKIIKLWSKEDGIINTNDPIANAILNQKYMLAKNKGITTVLKCNDLAGMNIEKEDLVTLLANLLDNSIEACEKMKKEKIIYFSILNEENCVMFSSRNPIDKSIVIKNNMIATTKDNKEKHGIGLSNIDMVIKKYNGMGKIICEDGYFQYLGMIPKNREE